MHVFMGAWLFLDVHVLEHSITHALTHACASHTVCHLSVPVCHVLKTGYKVWFDTDSTGADIRQASTVDTFNAATMAAACDSDVNCKGFNNRGWLKNVAVYKAASPGTCLYAKGAHISMTTNARPLVWIIVY